MASAHGHLNNEVMNNNRPPAPKSRKWLMRNNKSSLSGLIKAVASVPVPGLNILLLEYRYRDPHFQYCVTVSAESSSSLVDV